ncbi:MAG: hypothetical protein JJU45_08270 [Acidimicrobiia bacterium]|nr:hypothetical protein [Acidimicrobiia bacterium]
MRVVRVVVLVVTGLFFVGLASSGDVEPIWRAGAVLGLLSSAVAVRIVVGPAVTVDRRHLRLQRSWPYRRDIPWYRILAVDVDPMRWVLILELNNGDRVELPAVENLSELYDAIEVHRRRLDALDA